MANKPIRLFDTHCHFDFEPFSQDFAAHIQRARNAGVVKILIPSIGPQNWQVIASLTQQYPDYFVYALGFHPYFLQQRPDDAQFALLEEKLASGDKHCIAVGECGLDALIEVDMALQTEVFERQVELASRYHLPLILHSRKTQPQILAVLKRLKFTYGGILHGFSGSEHQAQEFIRLGFKIGVGGVITYSRAHKTRNTIANLPIESLVLETDAPDMPISGYQGQPNHPERLALILDELAALKGIDRNLLAQQLWRNFNENFNEDTHR